MAVTNNGMGTFYFIGGGVMVRGCVLVWVYMCGWGWVYG